MSDATKITRPGAGLPFARIELVSMPELVGARWWQESMAFMDPIARRRALLGIAAAAAGIGLAALAVKGCADSDEVSLRRDSLEIQKTYGWSFGNDTEALTFDGAEAAPVDRSALASLAITLAPTRAWHRPHYVPTLFQSVTAKPTLADPSDTPPKALADAIVPILTASMRAAHAAGEALASLLASGPEGTAVVVDLPGPEAIAFAAGLARTRDPVFVFDNWPHPRGVVPAHLTLAAALHYAPELVQRAGERGDDALPAFVLDANRLAPYADASDRFDNRYLARLPPPSALAGLGVHQILYVRPRPSDVDLDDVNATLASYEDAKVPVRLVAASDFQKGPDDRAYYGGSAATHYTFFDAYGWGRSPVLVPVGIVGPPRIVYRAVARATAFPRSSVGYGATPPAGFATVGVAQSRSGEVYGRTGSGGSTGRSTFFSGG